MQNDLNTFKNLNRIYQYKHQNAERLFDKQRSVVEACRVEHSEISASVKEIKAKLSANTEYMEQERVNSDPERMVKALKYKSQIKYDLEREEYYLMSTAEALVAEQLKLEKCRSLIETYRVKIENIEKMSVKARVFRQSRDEMQQDDDFISCIGLQGICINV